jgi:L-ascorbate metabolism protein UlaG (beta-lactamase superfamily)
MELVWYGHACFRLRGKDATVITDPFDRRLGLPLPRMQADIVTVSNDRPDHSNVAAVGGSPRVVDGPGEYDIAGVVIAGIATQKREPGRARAPRPRNTAYVIEIDGLTVCHLGDLADVPDAAVVEQIGNIDVLLIPVGGHETINATQATEVISLLEPRLVVPMHFRTPELAIELDPIEPFVREMGLKELQPQPRLSLSAGSLPEETEVVLLDYRHRG